MLPFLIFLVFARLFWAFLRDNGTPFAWFPLPLSRCVLHTRETTKPHQMYCGGVHTCTFRVLTSSLGTQLGLSQGHSNALKSQLSKELSSLT